MVGRAWMNLAALVALSVSTQAFAQRDLLQESPAVPIEEQPYQPTLSERASVQQRVQPEPVAPAQQAAPNTLGQQDESTTYEIGEIIQAADGAFGKATEGVAKVIEKIFADLGRPNAYITGREGGGAFIVGLRYGKGVLHSKIEGERTVHWNGPSIGPDVGGDASRSFVLVYNLHDSEEIYQRFPAVEGRAYLIGGVSANYHQRGDIVLVPIRLGAGWRLGANVGYLKYTKEGRILPF